MLSNQPFQQVSHTGKNFNQNPLNVEPLESQLYTAQLQVKQFLKLFPDAAWIADSEGRITDWNQNWFNLIKTQNSSPGERVISDQSFYKIADVIDTSDRDRFLEYWQRASKSKTEFSLSCRLLPAYGSEQSFTFKIVPIVENSVVKTWIGVCQPFSTNLLTNQQPTEAVTASDDAKSKQWSGSTTEGHFLSIMSHELRTPLNAILGFSQLLLRQSQTSLTLTQADMVHRILKNAHQLLALVDDVLCLSQLEARSLTLKVETFDIAQIASAVIDEVQAQAERQQLTLITQLEIANPIVVNDLYRLRQLLLKVLSNAIKFTELGEIYITLSEPSSDRLYLIIRDTGIGIRQEDLQYVFERFHQVDQTITRRYSGAGLGLAIAQRLIQLMNGSITITSEFQQGTTVVIELPRQVNAGQ